MPRVNIYIPDELKKLVNKFPDVNWSRVAQEAFATTVQELTMNTEILDKIDAETKAIYHELSLLAGEDLRKLSIDVPVPDLEYKPHLLGKLVERDMTYPHKVWVTLFGYKFHYTYPVNGRLCFMPNLDDIPCTRVYAEWAWISKNVGSHLPDPLDIVVSLLSDAEVGLSSYDEYCETFSCQDSIKGQETYRGCKDALAAMVLLFGPDFNRAMELVREL